MVWRQAEKSMVGVGETRKIPLLYWLIRNNLVLPSSSKLFKMIKPYRTMLLFRETSSITSIMSGVQSIYIQSSIRDWHLEVKIWTTDKQSSFCLWIPWTKIIRILIQSTWIMRVMHNTCIKHGKNIRTQFMVSSSILLWRKELKFSQIWSNAMIFHVALPAFLHSESC